MASLGAATASAANGCGPAAGPDWRSRLKTYAVVDAPFSFPFGNACNTHDRCYGIKWNRVASTYQAAKAKCDSQFYADMTRACYPYNSRSDNTVWKWCQYTAYGYYQGVDRWGGGPYSSAQGNVRR